MSGLATIAGAGDSSGIVVTLAGRSSGVTRTASDGRYRFAGIAGGAYVVVASADATREGTLTASVADGQHVVPDFVFHAVGTISGRVTRGGAAAGDAGIVVLAAGAGATTTDDKGAFTLDVAPGSYDLYVYTSGFLPGVARGLTVTRGATTMAPAIDLQAGQTSGPAGTLSGVAKRIGVDDGSGITVTLDGANTTTSTGADGSFTLADPLDGVYTLDFDAGDYHETVPSVLAIADASGFYLDGALYPLDASTLTLQRGRRQTSGQVIGELRASHDRHHVLFRSAATGTTDQSLYTLPAAGGTPLLLSAHVNQPIVLSPDGTHVAYAVGTSSKVYDLWAAGVDGSGAVHIGTSVQAFQYAPDGSRLFTQDATTGAWSAVAAAGGAATVFAQNDGAIRSLLSSPQGDKAVLLDNCQSQSGLCDLRLVTTDGTTAKTLAAGVYAVAVDPAFTHVAYDDGKTVSSLSLAGGSSTPLGSGSVSSAQFTPDGSQIIFYGGSATHTLSIVSVNGGTVTSLAPDSGAFLMSPAGHIAYVGPGTSSGARVVSIPDGMVQSLPGAPGYPPFVLSPLGHWVVMITYDAAQQMLSLSIAPAETGVFHTVTTNLLDTAAPYAAYVFSADETEIAYGVDAGQGGTQGWVEVQPTAGGMPTRLAGGANGLDSFSPSGTQLLYTVGSPPALWSVPTAGAAPRELMDYTSLVVYPYVTTRPFFVDDATVFAARTGAPPPFSFQNGLYRLRGD